MLRGLLADKSSSGQREEASCPCGQDTGKKDGRQAELRLGFHTKRVNIKY